ncbi:arabinan endo-1,5-alpha-L-arabinosidase [Marivirga lumbricoides]|uniref:Arabinan endo-1,5-alpha-L-arabinosidase n=1 Tax=Marivirga lumbricoides TaxID=1046115 RepID=A0A2T4DLK3_9BACT|nr:arabinan endo-1,5-alpha-L-arabinosidase [Marivirga lumbricoides]
MEKLKIGFRILLLVVLCSTQSLHAQMSDIRVHDPVMAKHDGTYYLFCTGMGIDVFSSSDMKNWKREAPVFDKALEWTNNVVPDFSGHIWAPDIHFYEGKYYLYYSVSAFAKNTSAIGVATNTTLNPQSSDFKWEDQGIVVQSVPNRDLWNAIDPNIIEGKDGTAWMSFGSFWEGLKMVKLSGDRTSIAEPQVWHTIAKRERSPFLADAEPGDAALEAPFIFKKGDLYYLFVSWDYCCRGENSTYKVVVGRSGDITGPFYDQSGKSMAKGGGTLVIEGNKDWAGAGHNSAYTFDGKDYFIFHAYDANDKGHSKLKVAEMSWTEDGWPVIDPKILSASNQ